MNLEITPNRLHGRMETFDLAKIAPFTVGRATGVVTKLEAGPMRAGSHFLCTPHLPICTYESQRLWIGAMHPSAWKGCSLNVGQRAKDYL